jgi:2-deoxy-D-gluconate 3-dehydrogenase
MRFCSGIVDYPQAGLRWPTYHEPLLESPLNPFDLTGRVAIVTGGNGGLGLAMARGLARAGASIALAARDESKGQTAVNELIASAPRTRFYAFEASSASSCRKLIEAVVTDFGACDILINNAGMNRRKPPEQISEQDWHEILDVNLGAALFCAQAAYPHMKAAGRGKILNIGSMYSLFGAATVAAYAASKGGLVQLTRSLACAWAPDNIQVNAILPGWIDTELTRRARQQVADLYDFVLSRTPAGRWGEPDDLAGAAVFLCSPASDFVTGAVLPVDGGYSARG